MEKSWIHLSKGETPRQAHIRVPKGLKEEEIGRRGFQGRVAELYHVNEPTGWIRSDGDTCPGDLDGYKLEPADRTDSRGRAVQLWHNEDISISVSRRAEAVNFCARNCDTDELWFVHMGEGVLETEFGPLTFAPGDYLVVPKGVTQRLVPKTRDNFFLHLQSRSEIGFVEHPTLGRHNPFDPDVITVPEPHPMPSQPGQEYELKVKRDGKVSSFVYPFNPMDVAGWKGDLFPFKFRNLDFRPIIADRNHVPPTAFGLFQGDGWVICNFVPAPLQRDREAARLPYYHRNVDFDEIGFMHAGTIAGAPIAGATFLWHPRGPCHGPGEEVRRLSDQYWEEVGINDLQAVNIDCVRPLTISDAARALLTKGSQLNTGQRMD